VEKEFENSIRPKIFDEFVGQKNLKKNLEIFLSAAKKRGESPEHILFHGPPGLGKTTLAGIVAENLNANLKISSGPAIEKTGDLAAILTNLEAGDVLFLDEIHRLRKNLEELLFSAMEDFAIDIVVGKGPGANSVRLSLPPFTLVGATTRAGAISAPLRDRFGFLGKLEFYENREIEKIAFRSGKILGVEILPTAAEILAAAARRTPRIANRLIKRMRDLTHHFEKTAIDEKLALEKKLIPVFERILAEFSDFTRKWKSVPMLARTHGQPASPTTVGKEFLIFARRLDRQIQLLKSQEFLGKFAGATGNFSAMKIAFPAKNWIFWRKNLLKI
jgi:Holliday junction DNA helicase RuvB